jgi:hypothetical protein
MRGAASIVARAAARVAAAARRLGGAERERYRRAAEGSVSSVSSDTSGGAPKRMRGA